MALKTYYQLVKPGIIYGNILTAVAGFLFASKWHIPVVLFAATIAGTSAVIGAACAFNNVMDRDIDKKMTRTKKRALVQGDVSVKAALILASVLFVAGFVLLGWLVNCRVVVIGAIGFIDYLALYGWAKRHAVYSTLVGSISGATPIAAGYVAYANRVDANALILFAIMVLWQMPHFYAIAMYRRDEYAAADLPVLTVSRGMRTARIRILAYIVALMPVVAALAIWGSAGYVYVVCLETLIVAWFVRGLRIFKTHDDVQWGRSMFLFSLIIVLAISGTVAIGSVIA